MREIIVIYQHRCRNLECQENMNCKNKCIGLDYITVPQRNLKEETIKLFFFSLLTFLLNLLFKQFSCCTRLQNKEFNKTILYTYNWNKKVNQEARKK